MKPLDASNSSLATAVNYIDTKIQVEFDETCLKVHLHFLGKLLIFVLSIRHICGQILRVQILC